MKMGWLKYVTDTITKVLRSNDEGEKCLILFALRWKVGRVGSIQLRRVYSAEYTKDKCVPLLRWFLFVTLTLFIDGPRRAPWGPGRS